MAPRADDGAASSRTTASRLLPSLRRAFLVAAVALAAVGLSAVALYWLHHDSARSVAHSRRVSRIARDLRVRTGEWDRALGQWVATGDREHAAAAQQARAASYLLVDSLELLTSDNRGQQLRAAAIRAAIGAWDRTDSLLTTPAVAARDALRAADARFPAIADREQAFVAVEDTLYTARVVRERRWQRAMVLTLLAEVAAIALVLRLLRSRLLDEAARDAEQQSQLQEQAVELEAQAAELQEQAVELEATNADLAHRTADAQLARGVAESLARAQHALIRALPEAVLVFDGQGRLLKIENTSGPALSRPAEALLGRPLHEVLPPETARACQDAIDRALARQEMVDVAYEVVHGGRVVSWEATASPMGPDLVVWVARDVSRRREQEAQLRQAQKMEAVGQLAGGIAHDFNNMLTAIRGYTQLAMMDESIGAELRDDLSEIDATTGRAATLTRQLLTFSRRQAREPRLVDLNAVVAGLEQMLQRLLRADVRLLVALSEEPAFVLADSGQLEQVLMNLAVNARDAMPEGGELRIATAMVRSPTVIRDGDAELAPGEYAALSVTDNGTGMAPETLARIFEPFFTTKAPGVGTGLGLATVYGIVQQSGGQLAVESELGRGTRFTVYLHAAAALGDASLASERRATPVVPIRPVASGGGAQPRRVLLVEDEESIRTIATRVLRAAGYEVIAAPDGEAALACIRRAIAPFDIVVTDISMPRMSGRELGEQLQRIAPGVPVLYMSGNSDGGRGLGQLLEAGLAFLEKPFTPARLVERVREILAEPSSRAG